MEQVELRAYEKQCIQEETPWCVASCPLHVDAKTFCKLMAQRRVDKAWQVLAKTLPLPGVLARLCDAPCRNACIRKEAGGAIEMGTLERFCAENAKPVSPPRPLPSRGKTVAVLGGGLAGLCASWEMAKRGFDVTLYCTESCGDVPVDLRENFPEGVLERELQSLSSMGVVTVEGAASTELLKKMQGEKDAVFVDTDAVSALVEMLGEPDELTLGTSLEGVFACRPEPSAILQAASGRRAANSIERFTQGVSMVTGRELEGPYETRLFTSLAKVESVGPVPAPYSEPEARDEAKRCLQCECMECVKACEYLRHFKFYPKVYARRVYNNESIVMGTRQANKMINSCALCGQCEVICPEDFSMADLCLDARRTLVEQGNMPPSAHEFALRDMAFADSEQCALARHAPGAAGSEYVFFPGCQLTASNPDGVASAYADLLERLGEVGLMLRCCGVPAEWSGRRELMEQRLESLRQDWESLGSPKIIAACPTCLKTLREGLPDAEVVSHWSVLRAMGVPEGVRQGGQAMAVNDPCAARHDAVLREDVRSLLESLGITGVEPEFNGETAPCCGYGGLLSAANPELGDAVAKKRADAMEEDYVTYCAMCRDMLVKNGKRAVHLYDYLYPLDSASDDDPGTRPSPGHSARRENRVHLRERLLRELWRDDDPRDVPAHEAIKVEFTEEARATMESRRILVSDIQKVLLQAQETGRHLVHEETGRLLASFRPVIVTYWVEYEEKGDGYLVHNTWSHRMHIQGGQA